MTDIIRETRHVSIEQAGQRIDQVAAQLFSDYSRARLQSWIQDGSLTIDGRCVAPKHRVAGGEWLRLETRVTPEGDWQAEDMKLEVIAADEQFIVLNKPAGLVVHPAAGRQDGTLLNGLLAFDPGLANLPRAGIVHRLDKDTTGVMVVARTLKAHTSLVAQLQARSVQRRYRAFVSGVTHAQGSVDAPIGRNPNNRKLMAVVAGGKPAVTHYHRLRDFGLACDLEVSLETGRTHQIRVHLKHAGHPLLGDPQYGPNRTVVSRWPDSLREATQRLGRQALHAFRLSFAHPASLRECIFEAPLPGDMARLLETLERLPG